MKKHLIAIMCMTLTFVCTKPVYTKTESIPAFDTVANTPPMGWNSWNCFTTDIKEEQVRANAAYMAEKLKSSGWQYVVVDLGWYLKDGVTVSNFKMQNPPCAMDSFGRLLPSAHKFPSAADSGFKALADYVHSLGLKFGIHIMRGIPREAVARNLSIKGTNYKAADIAARADTCSWYAGTFGVDKSKPGSQEYYNSLIDLYTAWGVDFIKADDMSFPYHKDEIELLSNAIKSSSRPIVLSLSPGAAPVDEAAHLQANAHMWRISPDFWDDWKFLKRQFELCRTWQNQRTDKHWPDCDMLPLGKLRVSGPDDYVAGEMNKKPSEITNEYSRFSTDEKYTLMSLWCIFRSPLMIGGHLPETDSLTLSLLTNRDAIAVNQLSTANKEMKAVGDTVIWSAQSRDGEIKYLAFFNLHNKKPLKYNFMLKDLHLTDTYKVTDIWTGKEVEIKNNAISASINPHGVMFIKLTP